MSTPIRIIIIEDNHLFRGGLKYLLDFSPDFKCIGDFDNGKDGFKAIKANMPDVVLMDIDLPGMNGMECTKLIKSTSQTPRRGPERRGVRLRVPALSRPGSFRPPNFSR